MRGRQYDRVEPFMSLRIQWVPVLLDRVAVRAQPWGVIFFAGAAVTRGRRA